MARIAESLAGSGQPYVKIQGRMISPTLLHVQGKGSEGNRPYGVSAEVAATTEFGNWLNEQPHTKKSLADSGKLYKRIQARLDGELIRFQVKGGPGGNRDYGFAFQVDGESLPELVAWLENEL